LHRSPKTIQAYPGRIKDKLQLSDAHELIREAIGRVESAGKRNRRTTRQPDDDFVVHRPNRDRESAYFMVPRCKVN
jgi:hypothetical protein